jgi:hypothetical protein
MIVEGSELFQRIKIRAARAEAVARSRSITDRIRMRVRGTPKRVTWDRRV